MNGERKLSFDVIRLTAIAMVVMVHVSAYVVTYFGSETAHSSFLFGNILNGLSRAGTPMFLMLSGALLLDERKNFCASVFYKKSLLSIALLLLFWLVFYASWRTFLLPCIRGEAIDSSLFLAYMLTLKGRFPHLWYLFMLIGCYLAVPLLRLFVKAENRQYILGFIIVALFAQFVNQTLAVFFRNEPFTLSGFIAKFHLEYATGYLPYMLLGWYLAVFPPSGKKRVALLLAGLLALVCIILSVQFKIAGIPEIREYMVEMNTFPALAYGSALFVLLNSVFAGKTTKSGIIQTLSRASFGVYITHVVFLDLCIAFLPYRSFDERNPLLYMLLVYAIVCSFSVGTTLLLSKVKGVRRLVRG